MTTMPPDAIHFILTSIWVGGLLVFLMLAFAATAPQPPVKTNWLSIQILERLSAVELLVLVSASVTGLMIAHPMVDQNYAAVFVTDSGWLLIGKLTILLLVLLIALQIHFAWLPALKQNTGAALIAKRKLRTWVTIEGLFALALTSAGTMLTNLHPPNHAVIHDWPYPFRFSIDGTWGMGLPDTVIRVWVGTLLFILAVGTALLGQKKRWRSNWRLGIPISLTICALGVGVPALTVPAYPETYRPTPVPFKASSVAHGLSLFTANCVPCHGPQAKGDGVLAKTLPRQPVNLLMEPHATMHTPGDFFHWLTNGIPEAGMPAWEEKFSEEERWDLVNLVHAISRGYQARIINPRVLPNQPFLAPPDFSYEAHDGASGRLKDFRRQNVVLVVVFSWPESRERLDQLKGISGDLRSREAKVLLVPMNNLDQHERDVVTRDSPFSVVLQGADAIARALSLFRRTIRHPDLIGEGSVPPHMEFLIDRYGYLRARWIPQWDEAGWTDTDLLMQQIDQLNREKEIKPPPGDFVHDMSGGMHDMSGMDMGGMRM